MIALEPLTTFITASILLALAPGTDNLFVLTQSALYGRKAGILITLGLCTGLIAHTTAVALGVTAIFQTLPLAFTLLKTIGAMYLLYLAWQAFFSITTKINNTEEPQLSNLALYQRGIIMNITNPKVGLFFLAFIPQFLSLHQGLMMTQTFIFGAVFILITLVVFSSITILSATLASRLKHSQRAQIYLNRTAGIVLAGLAVRLLLPGK
jgi:threonine/homoserine/homoserine lactone efflux protein